MENTNTKQISFKVIMVIILTMIGFTGGWIITTLQNKNTKLQKEQLKLKNELKLCNKRLKQEIEKDKLPENLTQSELRLLTDWVYKHSRRISRRTARQIVILTFKHSKNPILLLAIMERESNFNPTIVSKANAVGLGQILVNDSQIKWLKENGIINEKRDLYDIEYNIMATEFIFNYKLKRANGNIEKALYMYVGGKNKKYVSDILKNLGEIYILLNSVRDVEKENNGQGS